MEKSALDLLSKLGLNQYESRTYYALSKNGSATAGKISALAKIPRPRQYDVLASLEKKGFVMVQPGRPVKYSAREIAAVSDVLKKTKASEHEAHIKSIDSITGELKDVLVSDSGSDIADSASMDLVWTLRGRGNIYTKMQELIENASQNIVISTSEAGLARKSTTLQKSLKAAKNKGVKISIRAPIKGANAKAAEKLRDYATLNHAENGYRFMLFDNDHAILLLTPEAKNGGAKNEVALWVRSQEFAQNFQKLLK
ncbi:MAG: TrmB family transcriptional regulator [Candidatus Diapherotrites archaeon]|nr:TrmB family transcriptional regulator [Candidatus Diapherotrites archaeon]